MTATLDLDGRRIGAEHPVLVVADAGVNHDGDGRKRRMPAEEENATFVRRSWHLAAPVRAGEQIASEMLLALRPEGGLPPWVDPAGRVARHDLAAGAKLRERDLVAERDVP